MREAMDAPTAAALDFLMKSRRDDRLFFELLSFITKSSN